MQGLKKFDFTQILRFVEVPSKPQMVKLEFQGGQRSFVLEFLLQEQKLQFLRIMHLFVKQHNVPSRQKGCLSVVCGAAPEP